MTEKVQRACAWCGQPSTTSVCEVCESAATCDALTSATMTPVDALREIARVRLATDEGSLRVRADRIYAVAISSIASCATRDTAMPEGGHADTEGEAMEMFAHLNCPSCGGSGHIDDVAALPAVRSGWRKVVGREDQYEVNREGQVRTVEGRILGRWLDRDGYPRVRLNNPRATESVHRIVARAFCPNPQGLPVVNHLDCDRTNNSAENLEWCTQADNLAHSDRLGRMQRNYWTGRRSPSARLTDEVVGAIRSDYAAGGVSYADLAARYGTSKRSVGRILGGQSYLPAAPSDAGEERS